MIKNKKTFKNILYAVIQYLVTIICGFIVPRLIIQTYGSSVNGIISSITKFLGYITLLELGIGPVIKSILYKPISLKNKEEITAILKSSEKFFKKLSLIFIVYVIFLCIIFSCISSITFTSFHNLFYSCIILNRKEICKFNT